MYLTVYTYCAQSHTRSSSCSNVRLVATISRRGSRVSSTMNPRAICGVFVARNTPGRQRIGRIWPRTPLYYFWPRAVLEISPRQPKTLATASDWHGKHLGLGSFPIALSSNVPPSSSSAAFFPNGRFQSNGSSTNAKHARLFL